MSSLKRHIGPLLLTIYGLGGIIGAGVFALTGEIVGLSGNLAPLAFFVAGIPALLAALSYASLASAIPEAGGELAYIDEAFGNRVMNLSVIVAVFATGTLAGATLVTALAELLAEIIPLPALILGLCVLGLAACFTVFGVSLSVWLVSALTLIEIAALLIFIGLGRAEIIDYARAPPFESLSQLDAWWPVILGATVAFFAFIGFEDMVNMAEEVKRPARSFPVAILLAFVLSLILYALLAIVAQAALLDDQGGSEASIDALAQLAAHQGVLSPQVVRIIALISISNGVLIQINMASRLLMGAGKRGALPGWIAALNPRTGTPLRALLVVFACLCLLFLTGSLQSLAQLTSLLVLVLFVLVNTALLALRRQGRVTFPLKLPLILPVLGILSAAVLIVTSASNLLS